MSSATGLELILQQYDEVVNSPEFKIKQVFMKSDNRPLTAKQLASKIRLPAKKVEEIILTDIEGMGKNNSVFYQEEIKGKTRFSLNTRIFKTEEKIEEITKSEIAELSKNKDFITASDIFAKAIANANAIPYDEAAFSFGIRCAYLYYLKQQYESVALILNREKTTFEKRLDLLDTKSKDSKNKYCAVLKDLEKREENDFVIELIDNSIPHSERQLIRDFLSSSGLASEPKRTLTLHKGQEWRLFKYKIDLNKIENCTNLENVFFYRLNTGENLRIIDEIMRGLDLDDLRLDGVSKNFISWLKHYDLVTIEEQPYAGFFDSLDESRSLEELTSKKIIKLSPKILRYSKLLVNRVIEACMDRSLEKALEELNFEFGEEELEELGIFKDSLQYIALTEPIPVKTKLPVFFKDKPIFPRGYHQDNELICRIIDPEYEPKLCPMDIAAFVKKKVDLSSEKVWPAYYSVLEKLGKSKSSTSGILSKLKKNGYGYLQAIAVHGDPSIVEKYIKEVKKGKKVPSKSDDIFFGEEEEEAPKIKRRRSGAVARRRVTARTRVPARSSVQTSYARPRPKPIPRATTKVALAGESLNKVTTTRKKVKRNIMPRGKVKTSKKKTAYVKPRDIAAAIIYDNVPVEGYASFIHEIYVNAGYNEDVAAKKVSKTLDYFKEHGGVTKLAKKGKLDNIQKFYSKPWLEDAVEEAPAAEKPTEKGEFDYKTILDNVNTVVDGVAGSIKKLEKLGIMNDGDLRFLSARLRTMDKSVAEIREYTKNRIRAHVMAKKAKLQREIAELEALMK